VSVAVVRDRTWLTTVEAGEGEFLGAAWSSRGQHDPWRKSQLSWQLGASGDWLGAGVQLQPQLPALPDAVAALPAANVALPYAVSTLGSADGDVWVDTAWDLLVVDPR